MLSYKLLIIKNLPLCIIFRAFYIIAFLCQSILIFGQDSIVDLSGQYLREIPDSVYGNQELRWLILGNNELNELDNRVCALTNLTFLNLTNTNLKELPICINNLKNLSVLDLNENRFKQIPKVIYELNSLKYLNLNYNSLKHIDFSPPTFQNIISLSISNNKLKSLPTNLVSLKRLTYLDISNNKRLSFNDVSSIISNCKNLQRISISGLKIKKLDSSFNKLRLNGIDISNNPIKEKVFNILSYQTRLKSLNVSNCKLSSLPLSLDKLDSLEYLDLSKNRFTEIPAVVFEIKSLIHLSLSDNKIENLSSEIENLTNIEIINLNDNPLKTLPIEALKKLKHLKQISLIDTKISEEEQNRLKQLLPNCDLNFSKWTIIPEYLK
jgi:Leucine-rich repeat (LRR) protein